MWPRRQWSKLSSRTTKNPSFSSVNDLRCIVNDDDITTTNKKTKFSASTTLSSTLNATTPSPTTTTTTVFHRVRIATAALRAWKSLSTSSSSTTTSVEDTENKKIVLYFTSLRVVRKTFEECRAVSSILRGFRVAVDERDLSMDAGFLEEIKQITGSRKKVTLPRVFIGGRYVGGFEEVQQLHESGELKKMVEGVAPAGPGVCECCGGMRFILCQVCNGSHKYYSEKTGFRVCNACNENGIVRCPDCCSA